MSVNRQLISALKDFHEQKRRENWPAKLYTRLRIRVSPSSAKLFVITFHGTIRLSDYSFGEGDEITSKFRRLSIIEPTIRSKHSPLTSQT